MPNWFRHWSCIHRQVPLTVVVIALLSTLSSAAAWGQEQELDFSGAFSTLTEYCRDCHGDGAEEGGFALDEIEDTRSLAGSFERWELIRQRIADQSMPPNDAEPIPSELIDRMTQWIESASIAALCESGPQAGPPLLRRLAKHEYSNSVRDLLDIHFDAGQGLPDDISGGEGFVNAAETLIISPVHAEQYLQAAIAALDYAARDESARRRLLQARPNEETSEEVAARQNLTQLAQRAFRRPVVEEEEQRLYDLFVAARADDLTFDESVMYAMRGILISPSFLFIHESLPSEVGVAEPLTDHELAVRLSYFLWASLPDRTLRQAADEGRLSDPEELSKQTLRMINARGTHLQDSLTSFMGSWLGTADLGYAKQIDREVHPQIRDPHVAALRKQPVVAMEWILKNNASLLELIDADWTVLNNELVNVYRLRRNRIEGNFVQRLVRVELPEEYRYRAGLLGMGGTMVVSSYPRRSSPVLRGVWVLEKLLGVELPPPPPDVPALAENHEAEPGQSLRELLEQHRADPSCSSCHNRIDPIGFALENFDEIGRWRDRDEGGDIDPLAILPDGTEVDGVAGLKQYLLEHKRTFVRELTRKMLGYALGRSLRPSDLCTVEAIVQRLETNDYESQELILGIVTSEPFRMKILSQEETPQP